MKNRCRIPRMVVLALVGWLAGPSAMAGDDPGAADHPMVSRYPGQEIRWTAVENFMPYKVPAGPVTGYRTIGEWIETQGRVTRIFYAYEGADRTHEQIWENYSTALKSAEFEIIGEGSPRTRVGAGDVGGRTWQGIVLTTNPWNESDPDVNTLTAGTSSQGGSAAIVARKERAAGTAYVVINIEQHSAGYVGTLVDIIEVEAAQTGLIVVDAEAIGNDMVEYGRVVLDGIVFDFDKATLKAESGPALDAIAQYLAAHPDKRFFVVGHTDSQGTFAYNQGLSADRARAVADALKRDYGIAGDRLEPHGVGPLVPVFANDSAAGRDRNRRVELVERQAGVAASSIRSSGSGTTD